MPNPVQRSACDRCHAQKLRCSRSPHGGPCIRCAKVKAVCTWTPSTRRQSEQLSSKPPNLQESSIATPTYDHGNGIESMTPLNTSFPAVQTEFDFSALSTCPLPDLQSREDAASTWQYRFNQEWAMLSAELRSPPDDGIVRTGPGTPSAESQETQNLRLSTIRGLSDLNLKCLHFRPRYLNLRLLYHNLIAGKTKTSRSTRLFSYHSV
ncbi:hypothetical protein V1517DRAFT_189917 [Lipomyces orientalis]|uniref:Uncharacterized protein n=1 Tax=Lipomyces orientalis TaxID=1233043 RepID=A0ACC3TYK6_9ASCO